MQPTFVMSNRKSFAIEIGIEIDRNCVFDPDSDTDPDAVVALIAKAH